MKPLTQFLIFLLWIGFSFYWISRPPDMPDSFPESGGGRVPLRGIYNPNLAAALDQGLRDFWQKPDQVLEALGDLDGLKVADIGCGEGYFTLRLLELVGASGLVYATDIQDSVLRSLEDKIPPEYRGRVQLILSDSEHIGIPDKVDLILLVQVLGEVEQRESFLRQLSAIAHPETRLALIDSKHITDPDHGFTRPVNLTRLLEELNASGFVIDPEYDPSRLSFLPKQFFFVMRPEPFASEAAQPGAPP